MDSTRISTLRAFKNRRVVDIAYLLLANLFRVGLGIVTSAIIFRSLGPTDIGRMTTTLSIIGLLSIIGEFGLRDAAVNYITPALKDNLPRAHAIGRTFLVSKTFLATVATGVTLSAGSLVAARLYPQAQLGALVQLAAFSLLADGLLGFSLAILEAHQNFAVISLLNGLQSLLRFALIVTLFLASHANLTAMLLLETVIPLAVFIFSLRYIPSPYLALRRPYLQYLGLLLHFSKWIALAAFSSLLAARLDVLVLGYYQVPATIGIYAAALAVVNKLDLIKIPILTTALPDACRRTDKADMRGYVLQSLRLTLLISAALLVLFPLLYWIIWLLYGNEYTAAVPAAYLLLAAYLVSLNVEPAAFFLYPLNKPAWVAGKEMLPLVFFTLISLVLIPRYGIIGAAGAVLLRWVVQGILVAFLAWRYLFDRTARKTTI
jgi:O-antigen/teichoic acid export membrane protein